MNFSDESRRTAHGIAIICVVFASTALAIGTAQYAFGLFIEPLEETFGWTRTQIGLSASFAAVSGITAPLIGRAMDRFGARPILVTSLLITASGFLLREWMTELWHWYALSFLQFVCFAGMTILPTGRLVAAWFPTARGRMIGIAAMGNNFGGLVMPFAITTVMLAGTWRDAFTSIGVACIVVAILAAVIVRESPAASGAATSTKTSADATLTGASPREALASRTFYLVMLVITLGFFTYSTVLTHALAHLLNHGISRTTAAFALSTLAMGGLAGKLVFGTLVDRAGARFATVINLCGQATFACALAFLEDQTALVWVMPCFGLFMGGFGVVSTVLVQDAFGLKFFGSIMGLMNLSTIVSYGAGPLLAGLSFDYTGSYSTSFVIVACFFAIGAATLALTRVPTWSATTSHDAR